jgi:hypothetical protein
MTEIPLQSIRAFLTHQDQHPSECFHPKQKHRRHVPTAERNHRTEAFPWDSAPKYLIRDNDRAFGVVFKARVRAIGIRDRPTSFRSPRQNGYVERLIGSIRRD